MCVGGGGGGGGGLGPSQWKCMAFIYSTCDFAHAMLGCRVVSDDMAVPSDAFTHRILFFIHIDWK